MANSYHPFGYAKQPNTCLWCGCKLKRPQYAQERGLGRYGRGFFHSDSCAVSWAHRYAELGGRLVATEPLEKRA